MLLAPKHYFLLHYLYGNFIFRQTQQTKQKQKTLLRSRLQVYGKLNDSFLTVKIPVLASMGIFLEDVCLLDIKTEIYK